MCSQSGFIGGGGKNIFYKGPSENQSDNAQTDVKGKGVGCLMGLGFTLRNNEEKPTKR